MNYTCYRTDSPCPVRQCHIQGIQSYLLDGTIYDSIAHDIDGRIVIGSGATGILLHVFRDTA